MKRMLAVLVIAALAGLVATAQEDPSWHESAGAFRMIGNIYFVGTRGLSSFLITTPAGDVLIDAGDEATPPLIVANLARLGVHARDIKILVAGHAHFDHVGGLAAMQRLTGARVMVMSEDAEAVSSGTDRSALNGQGWTPVRIDRVLHDGDEVSLGGTTLTAHLTAGHTQGCTTWTMDVEDGGRRYHAVFAGSTSVNAGVHLVGNTRHPAIADDYARSFALLKGLHADVFFAEHPQVFGLAAKARRAGTAGQAGRAPAASPFIDPDGYKAMVDASERAYLARLHSEQR